VSSLRKAEAADRMYHVDLSQRSSSFIILWDWRDMNKNRRRKLMFVIKYAQKTEQMTISHADNKQ
jgi:hypothetical protein